MINEKMRELGSKRSTIRELFEFGKALAEKRGEDSVFDFSLGNPSIPAPKEVGEILTELISSTDPAVLHGYTSAEGALSVRESVARHIRECFGCEADATNVYMTVGAAAALTSSLHAVVCPDEEVIVLSPYFPEYKVFIEATGAKVKEVPCNTTDFHPSVPDIEAAINEKTAAIIINSPNNPTGAVYTEDDIKKIAELLERRCAELRKVIYIIADEPYRELVFDGRKVPFIPNYYRNTIVCYSYSKSLSLPGERIGYVFVSPKATESYSVFKAVCGAGRALGYVCAPALLQRLVERCQGMTSDLSAYRENRDILLSALTEYGYTVSPPEGAFYLFVKSPTKDALSFSEAAKRYGILLVPGEDFGMSGYVRLAYCQSRDVIMRSLPYFKALASELGILK